MSLNKWIMKDTVARSDRIVFSLNKREVLSYVTTWTILEDMLLSKISYKETNTVRSHPSRYDLRKPHKKTKGMGITRGQAREGESCHSISTVSLYQMMF